MLETGLLFAVAPHCSIIDAPSFIEELTRLAEQKPEIMSSIFKGISYKPPYYVYENKIEGFLKKLYECGLKYQALRHAERLKGFENICKLYKEWKELPRH